MEGFFGYCGRYEIDAINHVIYHYPEVALDPNSIGTKQSRPYKFDAEKLTFSDKDTAPGVASYAISRKKMRSPQMIDESKVRSSAIPKPANQREYP